MEYKTGLTVALPVFVIVQVDKSIVAEVKMKKNHIVKQGINAIAPGLSRVYTIATKPAPFTQPTSPQSLAGQSKD